jgi:CRISPR-associated protein Cas4
MEPYIPISILNDFIFCPRSIYFHNVHGALRPEMFQRKVQTEGRLAHESIDADAYSTRSDILVGTEVYSAAYNLMGKIDIFDLKAGRLIERKNRIAVIYDGYVFQVYAQCFCLREMGYTVKEIFLRDRSRNKNYPIPLPEDNPEMFHRFEKVIDALNRFDLNDTSFQPDPEKCLNCIYSTLCDYSLC